MCTAKQPCPQAPFLLIPWSEGKRVGEDHGNKAVHQRWIFEQKLPKLAWENSQHFAMPPLAFFSWKFASTNQKKKNLRHHWTQEGNAFHHLKVAQEHHQEKIRVFNIIFMNVQCSDSCSSFGVPAICCYFITRRTSTVFRKLTFDSSNVPTIWKEKKNVLCLRWKITASVTSCYLQINM